MIKKTLLYCGLVLSCGVLLISCAKKKSKAEKQSENNTLEGQWLEASTENQRRLVFMADGKFVMFMGEGKNYSIKISGNYTKKGDSLKVHVFEQLEKQDNKDVVKTELNSELFERAIYSVKDAELIIKYITYPADAPVETELKLKRVLSPG